MLVVGRILAHAHGREDERGQHHDGGGQQRQPADDGDGALGKSVLEPVAQLSRHVTWRSGMKLASRERRVYMFSRMIS